MKARIMMIAGIVLATLTWLLWYVLISYGCGFGATTVGACDYIWMRDLFTAQAVGIFWPPFLIGVVMAVSGWRRIRE
ncbi:MAG: hypothetical protein Q4G22_04080 [Paracoccus sp. (in: a-proteobacteria)]|uniref:hypothetical protein n=1 Tax=Paracoccus sp. TaxID=267 RepID=UPI0026DF17F0|nr:hypothetical protein [Paracoccus sp. (in: a-proteobacteria)]MDO5630996.1 hypothetical protein [Paracoccus sp. (in: a-proteobacteria)]